MTIEMLVGEPLTWNLPLLAGFLCIVFAYVFFLPQKIKPRKPLLFIASLLLLYLMIGSPITSITKLSFSFHMIQMGIIYFIIPPLLLLGIPPSMIQSFRTKLQPFSTILPLYLFSILLLLYHVPFVFIFLSESVFVQTSYEVVLFALAIGMWWPVASPDRTERLTGLARKQYGMKSGLWITPACLFFIVTAFIDAEHSAFLTQLTAHLCIPDARSLPALPPPFHTEVDQFFAGVSMFGLHKIGLVATLKLEKKSELR